MVRRPRRSAARALRPRQAVPEGRPGRGALDARRADAVRGRAGGRVRRQPHDRQPGAARAARPRAWSTARRASAPSPRSCYRVSSTLTIRDLHEEIVSRGHRHHAEVHLEREERAPRELAERLGLATGAPVFHSLIVHHDNGVPLQCEDRYVNPACAPGYLEVDFTRTTPTHYLLEVAPLWEAQYSIEASAPTAQEARLLGIDARRSLPRRRAAHDEPRRADHPGAPGASGSRYQLEGQLQPMTPRPRSPCADAPPQPWRNGGGVDARAARLARRRRLAGARQRRRHRGRRSVLAVPRRRALVRGARRRRRRADDRRRRAPPATPAMRRCRSPATRRRLPAARRPDARPEPDAARRAGRDAPRRRRPRPGRRERARCGLYAQSAGRCERRRRRAIDDAGRTPCSGSTRRRRSLALRPPDGGRPAPARGWWLAAGTARAPTR